MQSDIRFIAPIAASPILEIVLRKRQRNTILQRQKRHPLGCKKLKKSEDFIDDNSIVQYC